MSRGLTKTEAAAHAGAKSIATFDRWRRLGIVCGPIPGTRVWDRIALDRSLDAAQGLVAPSDHNTLTPYQRWKADNAAKAENKTPRAHNA